LRAIEDVKGFGAELQVSVLRDRDLFVGAKINLPQAGTTEDVTACIAKRPASGNCECSQVDPVGRSRAAGGN
jgi:hypothetical protein